ncbi:hypothetical protein Patl1_26914 [Pistacia atlantica]|uniref:Uncharacterized protein n=1 Tax=Pistacia atlantica TaxID=434234 RepID=A0ACC1B1Q9_9ROSI|nr:hypothetical protein Patl1_26914 [Pistacia atlantica]
MPGLTIGDTCPNLDVETTQGKMKIHDYVGNGWGFLFSHPGWLILVSFGGFNIAFTFFSHPIKIVEEDNKHPTQ